MKRKRTELEQNLIAKEWYLDHKTYTGNHSDVVDQYVYEKVYTTEFKRKDGKVVLTTFSARVLLDKRRTHIDEVLLYRHSGFTNEIGCLLFLHKLKEIEKEAKECYPRKNEDLSNEEVVECVEASETAK